MSMLQVHQLLNSGAVDRMSPDEARLTRDVLLADHGDVWRNTRHGSHDIMSRGIAALSRRAFGDGADLPLASDGTVRTGNE